MLIETVAAPDSANPEAPTTLPPANGSPELFGFVYPIAGGCLPLGDQLMPNAPRGYRNGIHEGVDFYNVDNCTPISGGTGALAAKDGVVIRADVSYVDPTLEEMNANLANPNTDAALDLFRGRQIWVEHGGGLITRYAHLQGIAPGIVEGVSVSQGQLIGYVGESGTPESVSNPGGENHLHFEVRLPNGSYLGAGEAPEAVRALYQTLFAP